MNSTMNRWLVPLNRVLVGLPVLSLVLAALAWLRYGIDIPWFDDWRGYAEGTIDSLDLRYLFRPVNDTMSPVGLALDALAQRYLDGNSVAYQFVSMVTVLGSLLALQWKLLNRALGNTLHAAVCFTVTLLMLQPGSYWGLDNLAYVQALPLVFILWALMLLSRPVAGSAWRGPMARVAGTDGGTDLHLWRLRRVCRWNHIHGGGGAVPFRSDSAPAGARCCLVHGRIGSHGRGTVLFLRCSSFAGRTSGFRWRCPARRSSGPITSASWRGHCCCRRTGPVTAVVVTVIACAIAVSLAALLLWRASSAAGTDQEKRLASVFVPLGAVVVVYLMLVAAGRTNLRPPEVQELLEIFQHGFVRFHFFWATLIWPWVVAAAFVLYRRTPSLSRAGPWWAAAFALVFAFIIFVGGGFDHMSRQKEIGEGRTTVANCLLRELQKGGEVRCHWLLPPRFSDLVPDSYPAFLYARKIGASFVRQFPIMPLGKRRETIAAFYKMDGNAKPRMRGLEALGNGVFRAVGGDPQLLIQTNLPQITRRCTTLDVEIDIKVSTRDTLQLFYAPAGDSEEYSELSSVKAAVGGDGAWQTVVFRLESPNGFFESLRLDPVTRPQVLEIRGIRLYCVWEMP